jgi:hypothetical protein
LLPFKPDSAEPSLLATVGLTAIKMRLLLQSRTGEFSFREFRDNDIPPYAILSHTWLAVQQGEEPTYNDLINGTGKEKLGYKKIQFCGE